MSDSAVIALRSWDSLTGNGLLVGQATRLAHGVYDPGPLLFWLLAFPVHLDPATGVLCGAAVWCMVAASLAIEAAQATAGVSGAVLASGMILGIIGWLPEIAMLPDWNPWFATMFFLAALAAGWAVLSGRQRWWPILVISASVAAQAHLMYAFTAACLLAAGLAAVVAGSLRARTYRWAVTGVIAGVACWAAPAVQQFTGRPGNLGQLVQTVRASGTGKAGLSFGLRALAAAAQPPPYWWRWSGLRYVELGMIGQRPAWFGAAALAVMALALVLSILVLRSRRVAALVAVSLLAALAALETYAGVPAPNLEHSPTNLSYLMTPMFPLGVLAWLAVGSVLVLGAWRATRKLRRLRAARQRPARPGRAATAWTGALAAVMLMVTLTVRAALHTGGALQSQRAGRTAVAAASAAIQREVPAGRIVLTVVANGDSVRPVTMGLAYALRTRGYTPQISGWSFQLGPAYSDAGHLGQQVTVFVNEQGGARVAVGGSAEGMGRENKRTVRWGLHD